MQRMVVEMKDELEKIKEQLLNILYSYSCRKQSLLPDSSMN